MAVAGNQTKETVFELQCSTTELHNNWTTTMQTSQSSACTAHAVYTDCFSYTHGSQACGIQDSMKLTPLNLLLLVLFLLLYSSSFFPSIITCQSDNPSYLLKPFSRTTWRLPLRGGRHSMTFIQHWKEVCGRRSQLHGIY